MKQSNKLLIIVTKECNRKCPFCIDRPNKNYYKECEKFIDIVKIDGILEFAHEHNIKTIALNGGEPTLHPQIVEIAKKVKDAGFILKIFTNCDFPNVLKKLDGIVDIIRISYYGPMNYPKQSEYKSKLTLKIMLTKETFPTFEGLVKFIQENKDNFYDIKIHTLMQNNDYSINNQVEYLEDIEKLFPLKRNDKGDYYHDFLGLQIEREDLPNLDYDTEQRLYKVHMDGTISHYFEEDHYELNNLNQDHVLTKALRAHRNQEYRDNVKEAYARGDFDIDHLEKYLPKKKTKKMV